MKRTNKLPPPFTQIYIGIDNGVSGSVGWVAPDGQAGYFLTPVFSTLNYTKKAANVNRIDVPTLIEYMPVGKVFIERPMVNPGRFQATASALRAMEATLIAVESMGLSYQFIDSKEWQKVMLPSGIKGAADLKRASLEIGKRIFPQFSHLYKGDADGILIAEVARRGSW